MPGLLREVLPDVRLEDVVWERVHPRAFIRELRVATVFAALMSAGLIVMLGWWDLLVFGGLVGWSAIAARQYVRNLGWSITDRAVALRTGWLRRHLSIARFTRIQAVTLQESPFDRRTGMASVRVDTAGGEAHAVDIPYLPKDVAVSLFGRLSAQAAQTDFKW